jgi:DNA-binding GntR family transcriptional regulator
MSNENVSRAYKFIRHKILSSEYAPGVQLGAKPLAEKIGVSRTPVRDALRQLETEGLVVIRPRLGATVKFMSLHDFKEHCGVRQALECYAAGLAAANRTDSELEEIRQSHQAMEDLFSTLKKRVDRDEYDVAMAREDIRFHMAIMAAAKNSLLKSEILRLRLINRVVGGVTSIHAVGKDGEISPERRDAATLKEHADILNAIAARDVAAAKSAMEFHIQDIIDHSIKKMGVEESSQINSEFGL